jgi:hypothetical protein
MAALIALIAISGVLFGGFVAVCRNIRRTDKWGTLRPGTLTPHRHHMLTFASRWDNDTPPLA